MRRQQYPASPLGWHKFYVREHNKTGTKDSLYLAMLYLNFHLAYGGEFP